MKQLLSIDADFLFTENKRTPLHISTVNFYDADSLPHGKLDFEKMLKILENRLGQDSMVRYRLIPSPFNLSASYWREDPNFDLRNHVLHICLPKPCTRSHLNRLLTEIDDYPMNNTQPPWDAYFIEWQDPMENLPEKCFCMIIRMHHSFMKDAGDFAILRSMHTLSPKPREKTGDAIPPETEPFKNTINIPLNSWYSTLNKTIEAAISLSKAKPAISRTNRVKKHITNRANKDLVATRFNGAITSRRVLITKAFDLDEIREIKTSVTGVTVIDTIVALISGALSMYLKEKKELPPTDLKTILPIYLHSDGKNEEACHITAKLLNLCTTISDPVKRIRQIHEKAVTDEVYSKAVSIDSMLQQANSQGSDLVSHGMRTTLATGIAGVHANTAITYVPGSEEPFYMGRARLVESYCIAPLVDGIGLSHVAIGYCNRLLIAITSCKKMLPDPELYEKCLIDSYDQMLKAARLKHNPSQGKMG